MKRLLFRIFIVILCVDCTISSSNAVRRLLNALGIEKEFEELNRQQPGIAFVVAAEKYSQLENTVIEVSVIDHLRRILELLIDKLCRSKKDVREAAQQIKDPPDTVLPIRLISAQNNAKTASERKFAQKHISTFKNVYRQLVAILEYGDDSIPDVVSFKRSLRQSNILSNGAAALGGAKLYSELSDKIHNEDLERNVNWNNKEAVLRALKYWNIDQENVVGVAAALHDLRSVQAVTT